METTTRKTAKTKSASTKRHVTKGKKTVTPQQNVQEEKYLIIPYSDIDISPLNYRRVYNSVNLEELAGSIAGHGLIQPVKVRRMPNGRYELVVGERRYRAAALAGLKEIKATVADLTDEQVREIQLSENLQREDPHPLHESFAIADLLKAGKTIEEIAMRLGKSKTFIYSRIKLSAMIEPLQEMFLAAKFNIQESYEIAALSESSQHDFFDGYCTGWEKKDIRIYNLYNILSNFKYDLKKAPFDTTDEKLIPEKGACTDCPFNSATLKTLFAEFAKNTTCTDKSCYKSKCTVNLKNQIHGAVAERQPSALLFPYKIPDEILAVIEDIPEIKDLPQLNRYDVTELREPVLPDKEDFVESAGSDEENETPGFDDDAYKEALEEYRVDLEEHEAMLQSGKVLFGLYISGFETKAIWYSTEKNSSGKPCVTAKDVQQAIKAGTATPELLRQEIERIEIREQRAKELDREKVVLNLHTRFTDFVSSPDNNLSMTDADKVAAKLVVYQSLSWAAKRDVDSVIFKDVEVTAENLFSALAGLTDAQYAYMVRMAIVLKHESKTPQNLTSYCLYRQASDAAMDVAAIEQEQEQNAKERQRRLDLRLAELEHRIKVLSGNDPEKKKQ